MARRRGKIKLVPLVISILVVSGCVNFVNGLFDGGSQPSLSSNSNATESSRPNLIPTATSSAVEESAQQTNEPSSSPTIAPSDQPTAALGEARLALDNLEVKGRAPKTGYDRGLFSDGWGSYNGCDWRNRILARDLTSVSYRDDCIVESGLLSDPYTGNVIAFTRGVRTSLEVQIDHVVAVSDAWQKGAQQLNADQRYSFYNDPLNLLAVDGPTNSSKGDSDAASWLPPNKSFRCHYVARQVAVKQKYRLWVTQAEYDAIDRVLDTCPTQKLPD